jgi:very-short-patch-repair endonuclease
MRPKSARLAPSRSDSELAARAERQHGVLTIGQLEALGLSARAVRHRAAAGRLTRVHTGVYSIHETGRLGRWMAAVLACGSGAMLSHRSAAALWGLSRDHRHIDVTVAGRTGRSRAGITVHGGGALKPHDVSVHDRIPCTAVARTLLDLAGVVERRALERAVDRAEELRLFDLVTLQAALSDHPRHPGRRALASLLAEYRRGAVTCSTAEEQMLKLIAASGIPQPRVNTWIALEDNTGYEADFFWPDARLIAEVDSRTYHAKRRAFAHDRQRDRKLALAGFETHRYLAAELTSQPEKVIAELRTFLSRR